MFLYHYAATPNFFIAKYDTLTQDEFGTFLLLKWQNKKLSCRIDGDIQQAV